MEPTGVQGQFDARRRLLEEGATSYHDAVTALIAFQREVQKKCREVMTTHLVDYSSALKVQLVGSEIQDAAWPSFAKWEGDWWCLGTQIVRRDISKIRWWESYCCLQHDSGEQGLFSWVGEFFPTQDMASIVHERFIPFHRDVKREGKHVWLEQPLKLNRAADFDEGLVALFPQWIELWQKVGGIKELFK